MDKLFCGSEVQVCVDSNDGATDSRGWAGCQAYTDNTFDWYVFFISTSLVPSELRHTYMKNILSHTVANLMTKTSTRPQCVVRVLVESTRVLVAI